mgnify:CR=1 FL=1
MKKTYVSPSVITVTFAPRTTFLAGSLHLSDVSQGNGSALVRRHDNDPYVVEEEMVEEKTYTPTSIWE